MQDLFTVINGMNTVQAKDAYRQLLGTSLNNTQTISNSLSTFNTNLFDRLPEFYTESNMENYFAKPVEEGDFLALRDRTIVSLIYSTGIIS